MTNINTELDKKISNMLSKYKNNDKTEIINLVLSGGGLKGLAELGALNILAENGLLSNIKSIAASSIGAIIAGMYCIGYSFDELFSFINMLDISNIISIDPSKLINCFGLDDGARLEFVLSKMLEAKNVHRSITLKELYEKCKINLIVTSVCLNDSQVYYLSHTSNPDMPLVTCLRMSSAIPIVFKPILYKNKTYIDGGCMDNYPVHLFKNDTKRTIGIYVKDVTKFRKDISNMEDYLFSLIDCLMEGVSCNLTKGFEKNTIIIDLPSVSIVSSHISTKLKKELYVIGCEKAKKFVAEYK